MKLLLYSAKWCGMCTALKKNFNNNPPKCDYVIKDCTDDNEDNAIWEAEQKGIRSLPCCILYSDDECLNEITRWFGVIKTSIIDKTIEDYESKHMV